MRTIAKILLPLVIANIFWSSVFASPLDILAKYRPDIAVTDIRQDTRYVYVKVCNLGGVLPSSAQTLIVALKKSDG